MSSPRHPKIPKFLEMGLFNDLQSFAELESRIEGLEPEKEKGDAFEVFALAYISSSIGNKLLQATDAWPLCSTPSSILEELQILREDMGIDGVFKTRLKKTCAYQVKFRSNRTSLSWDDVSHLLALGDQADQRYLFTNSDLGKKVRDTLGGRKDTFCTLGTDLDKLTEDELAEIINWLQEKTTARREPKTPRPHQQEALDQILLGNKNLIDNDRVTSVMPCGSGKTLVSMWVAEDLESKKILVLLPSLSLLRQTLHEWLQETMIGNIAYLCVCSDKIVKGQDTLQTSAIDLDFPVTTDSEEIQRFVKHEHPGTKIVFSTYQSVPVLRDALADQKFFELGIFDEAHKTAGKKEGAFAVALDDDNLFIRKRFFQTATPRTYNAQKKDKYGELKRVFSMDDEEVYGPICHELSFAQAIREEIICDYRIIISVIDSNRIDREVISRSEVPIEDDLVRAKQVANQIAIKDVVEKSSVRKILTFHRSVLSAKSFSQPGNEGIGMHLPDFLTYHVNGKMPTASRDRLMQEFEGSAKSVITNAKCLTEGVDMPAIDLVAFLSPKRSRIDIVQATGRAMRTASGKERGHILVPLFLELKQDETIEEALERSDFDEVWDVLNALKEQDEILYEAINRANESIGEGKGYDDSLFGERVEIWCDSLQLKDLEQAISIRCVERISASWYQLFGKLKQYKDEHGDCNVPRVGKDKSLGNWVGTQRQANTSGTLTPERVILLDDIGFDWDPRGRRKSSKTNA